MTILNSGMPYMRGYIFFPPVNATTCPLRLRGLDFITDVECLLRGTD